MNNVDDILVMGKAAEPKPVELKAEFEEVPERDDEQPEKTPVPKDVEAKEIKEEKKTPAESKDIKDSSEPKEPKENELSSASSEDHDQDEYGNDIPKKQKTYTEEEVQRMIRDRLQRGNHQQAQQQQQPTQQQVNNAASEFQFDENSGENWQQQLERFVDNRLENAQKKNAVKQQQEREQRAQAEFESKFNNGMSKYPDFANVLQDKPVTDAMVMATRAMNDPAAFLYAAAKKYPNELDRISKIPDAYQQATEIGRLEERMKKAREATRAAKPMDSDKTNVVDVAKSERPSIDHLIERHAKTRARR